MQKIGLKYIKNEAIPRSANRQNGERFQLYNINAFKIINMPEKKHPVVIITTKFQA